MGYLNAHVSTESEREMATLITVIALIYYAVINEQETQFVIESPR